MKIEIDGWLSGEAIPSRFAFGKIPEEGRFALSDNISPAVRWSEVPEGTVSFALICHDPDVPSVGDDVNQEGKEVSADLLRVDFYHWVLVNIPADRDGLDEGEASSGVTAGGKDTGQKPYGVAGANTYTAWFEGDPDMGGVYGDYDGPCPPWNDQLVHRYIFTVYALDTDSLELPDDFDGTQALELIKRHSLGSASYSGTYTMNRDL